MLYLITGVGLVLFVAAVTGLVLLVRSGQFDDLDTPPHRLLGDDIASPGLAASPPAPPQHSSPKPLVVPEVSSPKADR